MGRVLDVTSFADRIQLSQILVDVVQLLTLSVKRAPELCSRGKFYQPIERPHDTKITLTGKAACKEIGNSENFYAQFGHIFMAIKVILSSVYCVVLKCSRLVAFHVELVFKTWRCRKLLRLSLC